MIPRKLAAIALLAILSGCSVLPTSSDGRGGSGGGGATQTLGGPSDGGSSVVIDSGGDEPPPEAGAVYLGVPLPGATALTSSAQNSVDIYTTQAVVDASGTMLVQDTYRYFRLESANGVVNLFAPNQLEVLQAGGVITDATLLDWSGDVMYGYTNVPQGSTPIGALGAEGGKEPPPPPPPPPVTTGQHGGDVVVGECRRVSWGELKAKYR